MKKRPSPWMIVAVAALSFALVGTAIAGTDAASRALTKSKVKSIAKKQADKELKANVAGSHVNTADTASKANSADSVGANGVNSAAIATNAVTTAKIADNAVTTAKIADNAVTNAKIANNAVTAGKIANGSVGASKLGAITLRTGTVNNVGANTSVNDITSCNAGEIALSAQFVWDSGSPGTANLQLVHGGVTGAADAAFGRGFNSTAAVHTWQVNVWCLAP
jgi:hypothetical protein